MISPLKHRTSKQFNVDDLIQVRHDMMCVYGWISLKEFKEISIPELFDLYELVKKELEQQYKKYVAVMSLAGAKKSDI